MHTSALATALAPTPDMTKLALVARRTDNIVIITDAVGRIEWVNDAFTRTTEYTLEEVRGLKPGSFLQGVGTDAEMVEAMGAAVRAETSFQGVVLNYTRSGRPYWLRIDIQPVFDGGGTLSNFIAIETDITRERVLESRLLRAEEIARMGHWQMVPETGDMVWSAQARRIFDVPADVSPSLQAWIDRITPEGRRDLESMLDLLLTAGGERQCTVQLQQPDGGLRSIDIRGEVQWDDSGRPHQVFGIVQDVTERHEHQLTLERAITAAESANRMKTDFLATMSHELRTPLNAVIGYSQMIADEMLGPVGVPRYLEYAKNIEMSGSHLLDLLTDLLDLSRIDAGHYQLRDERVELRGLIGDCTTMLNATARERGLVIQIGHLDAMTLVCDVRALKQVLLNLMSNAMKFSEAGGRVRVDATVSPEGDAVISIEDSGIGIPADQLARVLEPFTRATDPRVKQIGGTGIGLPLSKKLMELHGGSLTLNSVPKQGTTVTVRMPRERVEPGAVDRKVA